MIEATNAHLPPRMTTVLAFHGRSLQFAAHDGRKWVSLPNLNRIDPPTRWKALDQQPQPTETQIPFL